MDVGSPVVCLPRSIIDERLIVYVSSLLKDIQTGRIIAHRDDFVLWGEYVRVSASPDYFSLGGKGCREDQGDFGTKTILFSLA